MDMVVFFFPYLLYYVLEGLKFQNHFSKYLGLVHVHWHDRMINFMAVHMPLQLWC